VKETQRHKLGKLLGTRTRNLLLMSATPHNGKEADFQLFMGLLDADRFEGRFREGVHKAYVSDMAAAKGEPVSGDDTRWLKAIDQLRSNLVSPAKAASRFQNREAGEQAARVYAIYEAALRDRNIMDFNGMILDTCRLAHQVPAVVARN
jgi:superfamily I DNA/RNA helicase